MANIIDGRASSKGDFFGTPFGFEFGLSSADDISPVMFQFDIAPIVEAQTDASRVTLASTSGLGKETLTVFGSFTPLPADPTERAAWRDGVNATLVYSARQAGPENWILDVTFDTPRRVDAFGGTVTDFLAGDDKIIGTRWADFLGGKAGNDFLIGGGGNDVLDGGAGDDVLKSGAGQDSLTGADGNDRLIGGAGNDVLFSGFGNDVLLGGGGNDFLFARWGDAGEKKVIKGGGGDDLIELSLDAAIEAALAAPAGASLSAEGAPATAIKIKAKVQGGGGADTVFFDVAGAIAEFGYESMDVKIGFEFSYFLLSLGRVPGGGRTQTIDSDCTHR